MYKFYLNFKNDNTGRFQISETYGFDAASFFIEQDNKRYGRDVSYMNEEVDLEFYSNIYESSDLPQTLPNGTVVNYLTHGFEYLINYRNEYGFESEVEFIIEKDGFDFITGVLDFETCDTDEYSYFKTKVIQKTSQAVIKRREDVEVDLFSDEDLDGNPITPIQTSRILLKAKPVAQLSKWKNNSNSAIGFSATNNTNALGGIPTTITVGANNCNVVENYGIENTLSFMSNRYSLTGSGFPNYGLNFTYIEAQEDLKDVTFDITDLIAYTSQNKANFFTNIVTDGSGYVKFVIKYGYDTVNGSDMTEVVLYEKTFGFVDNTPIEYLPTELTVTIPLIRRGQRVYIYLEPYSEAEFNQYSTSSLANYTVNAVMQQMKLQINGTSVATNSVVDGIRTIDLYKQVAKSINGFTINAPKFDVGGVFYDNFCFNGKLIRQFSDKPFYAKFKDCVEQLQELNSDYQVNDNEIYIGQYSDFYPNNEIGAFVSIPDVSFKSDFNKRYTINTAQYKYKSFEQDRDEAGTIDAVHTDTQWLFPNKQVENNLKIDVPFVRDPFEIESARKQGIFTKENTSLSNDDKIYQVDVVELAPNSRDEFTAVLQWQSTAADSTVKILSNGNFNWELLGFQVGDSVIVSISLEPNVTYTVTEITSSVLTLLGTGTIDETNTSIITINYPLTDVQYTIRTNEEFQNIENVANPNDYGNLQYTIKRNLQYWYPYFKTACKYKPNGIIRNTYFKSNGELITEFRNGGNIQENANINVSELPDAYVTPKIYYSTVVASFEDVYDLLIKMQTVNLDNSIGGFVRIADFNNRLIKGFIKKLEFSWATNELTLEVEEKEESDLIQITTLEANLFKINETGYDTDIVGKINYKINGDYCQLFDKKGIPLTQNKKFNFYLINSNNFSNIVELAEALNNL